MSKSPPKKKLTLAEFESTERGMLWSIADFTSDQLVSAYSESLGVKAPEAAYRSALVARESTRLAGEAYLLNAKRSTLEIGLAWGVFGYNSGFRVKGALSHRDLQEKDAEKFGETVDLPAPQSLKASLGSVLRSRRSIRKYGRKSFSLSDLSTLLYYADGVSGDFDFVAQSVPGSLPETATFGEEYIGKVRTAPSGGGLYPISLYFLALHVDDLPRGIYRYLPHLHKLELIRELEQVEVEEYFRISGIGKNIDEDRVAVSVGYVYSFFENARKYGDISLQFALIEAGEIAENLQLTCTAKNWAATDLGGYEKSALEQFIGLDGLTHHLIHWTLVGRPA